MFTGIIETLGTVARIETEAGNMRLWIESNLASELKVDQSLSHNGVCLTVEASDKQQHQVTAIAETLQKTNFSDLSIGDSINLERCVPVYGRLDGHIVQGHVDTTALCIHTQENSGSYEYQFEISEKFAPLIIEKGSISINGISLTLFNVGRTTFTVAIIPYTFEHTNISDIKINDRVNIEFDILGKYVLRKEELNRTA